MALRRGSPWAPQPLTPPRRRLLVRQKSFLAKARPEKHRAPATQLELPEWNALPARRNYRISLFALVPAIQSIWSPTFSQSQCAVQRRRPLDLSRLFQVRGAPARRFFHSASMEFFPAEQRMPAPCIPPTSLSQDF